MSSDEFRSKNFAFLAKHDPTLADLPTSAENYLYNDPVVSLFRLRQFGEQLAIALATLLGVSLEGTKGFADTASRLSTSATLPREVKYAFRVIREYGNSAVHSLLGDERRALEGLEHAHLLAKWFHQTMTRVPVASVYIAPPRRSVSKNGENDERIRELEGRLTASGLAIQETRAAFEAREADAQANERALQAKIAHYRNALKQLSAEDADAFVLRGRVIAQQLKAPADHDRPSVWVEQASHLENFVGRSEILHTVFQWVRETTSGYLLLEATPGEGKSALCARIAADLHKTVDASGYPIPVLLHMGKSGSDPRQILQFLLWQTRGHLAEALNPTEFSGGILDLQSRLMGRLREIVTIFGSVVLVVDALDEIATELDRVAKTLQFLPNELPEGVKVVVTSRPIASLTRQLQRLRPMKKIALPKMSAAEIVDFFWNRVEFPVFDFLQTTIGFDNILSRTTGTPLLLRHIADIAPAQRANHDDDAGQWIPQTLHDVFLVQYDQIRESVNRQDKKSGRIREAIAQTLAVSPAALDPSRLAMVCSVLLHTKISTLAIRDLLDTLGAYAESTAGSKYRLYHQGLADSICERLGSDGRMAVFRALANCEPANPDHADEVLSRIRCTLSWHTEANNLKNDFAKIEATNAIVLLMSDYATIRKVVRADMVHDWIDLSEQVAAQCGASLSEEQARLVEECRRVIDDKLPELVRYPEECDAIVFSNAGDRLAKLARVFLPKEKPAFREKTDSFVGPRSLHYPESGGVSSARLNAIQSEDSAHNVFLFSEENESIGAWNRKTGKKLWRRYVGNELPGDSFCVSKSGAYVAIATKAYKFGADEDGECDLDPIAHESGILLLDGRNGTKLWSIFPSFQGVVGAIAFSDDERYVYIGTGDDEKFKAAGAVRQVETATGRIVSETKRLAPVRALSMDSSGRLISCGGWLRTKKSPGLGEVAVWDQDALRLLAENRWESRLNAIALLDSERLAFGIEDGKLLHSDLTLKLITVAADLGAPIVRFALANDAQQLFAATASAEQRSFNLIKVDIRDFSEVARRQVSAGDFGSFSVDRAAEQLIVSRKASTSIQPVESFFSVEIVGLSDLGYVYDRSHDLRTVVKIGVDGVLGAYITSDDSLIQNIGAVLNESPRQIGQAFRWNQKNSGSYFRVSQDGVRIAVLNDLLRGHFSVLMVEGLAGQPLEIIGVTGVNCVDVALSGDLLAVAAVESTKETDATLVTVLGEKGNELREALKAANSGVISKSDKSPMTVNQAGITIFDIGRQQTVLELAGWKDDIRDLLFSPDSRHFSVVRDDRLTVTRIEDGFELIELPAASTDAFGNIAEFSQQSVDTQSFRAHKSFFSQDGDQYLVMGLYSDGQKVIRRWDLNTNRELPTGKWDGEYVQALLPDQKSILVCSDDGISLKELLSGAHIASWRGTGVRACALRSGGEIAVLTGDGGITTLSLIDT